MEARQRKRGTYRTAGGTEPFIDWLQSVRRLPQVLGNVLVRLKRAEEGNFGDHRSVGEGVIELRIDFGPGYRVYLGIDGDDIILLWGGSKKTQREDIKTAKEYWRDYNA